LKGRKIAFLGDTACNMANSWILGANLFGMKISLAGPKGFEPGAELKAQLAREGFAGSYEFTTDPFEAVKNADVVYTDVWVSMGKEEETAARIKQMSPYAVTAKLFAAAKPDALFMHCLPAHAGEEVEQAVLDNPRSIIFDQAENRLHMQKAIMAVLAAAARK
jgi:ornithine carbamoyltransferase